MEFPSELIIDNHRGLKDAFSELGRTVPSRTGAVKREKTHKEFFCLRLYLKTLADAGSIDFPIRVLKQESPDFFLTFGNLTSGLEVTEATDSRFQQWLTLSEGAGAECELFPGDGWVGEYSERKWCADVIRAINRKFRKISKNQYIENVRTDLLIYDNCETSVGLDLDRAMTILREKLNKWQPRWNNARLGIVSILRRELLIHDVFGASQIFACKK